MESRLTLYSDYVLSSRKVFLCGDLAISGSFVRVAPYAYSRLCLQPIHLQTPSSPERTPTTPERRPFDLNILPCSRSSLVSRNAVYHWQVTSHEKYNECHNISTVPEIEVLKLLKEPRRKYDSTISSYTRLIAADVCFPLGQFLSSVDLVIIIFESLLAHKSAWKVGVLHCDVSESNVMFQYDENHSARGAPCGLLVDWDLSMEMKETCNNNRSGTWAFMSALRQKYPKKPRELSDDLEAFVHVIIWCALRYLPLDMVGKGAFTNFIWGMYEYCIESADGVLLGCHRKWDVIESGRLPFNLVKNEGALQEVISALLQACKSHYATVDLEDYRKYLPADINTLLIAPRLPDSELTKQGSVRHKYGFKYPDNANKKTSAFTSAGTPTKTLNDHTCIRDILLDAIANEQWPDNRDMKRDNMGLNLHVSLMSGNRVYGAGSTSHKRSGPPNVSDSNPSKRQRSSKKPSSVHTSQSGTVDVFGRDD